MRSGRLEDDQNTQGTKQFWREVFDNVLQQEVIPTQQSSRDAPEQFSNGQPPVPSDNGELTFYKTLTCDVTKRSTQR